MHPGERLRERRQPRQGIAQRAEVARCGAGAGHTRGEALEIGEAAQPLAESCALLPRREPAFDRVQPALDGAGREQRPREPRAQAARAEAGHGLVQVVPQGVLRLAPGLRLEQLEVALGGRVVAQHVLLAPALDARELAAAPALHAVEVVERPGGRGQCGRHVLEASDLLRPAPARQRCVPEAFGRHRAHRPREPAQRPLEPFGERRIEIGRRGHHPLGDADARHEIGRFGPRQLEQADLAGRCVGEAQARDLGLRPHGREKVVGRGVEELVGGDRAWRQDLRHAALDQALRARRVLELVADRDLVSEAQQPRDVGVALMPGHAAHRDRLGILPVARGEGETEELGSPDGVLEEHLVEVAQPEEQERVRMLGLDARVLLHERRARGRGGSSAGHGNLVTW